jgi:hypothetical protein
MAQRIEPVLGDWYKDSESQIFEIVALDQDERTIEIQYFDGAVEELDYDVWYEKEIEPCAEPEDWSGPFDDLEKDDFGDTDSVYHPTDLNDEIDHMD